MKDIQGYEGLYAITSRGKIWSYRSNKFLKPYKSNKGYLYVKLFKNGIGKAYSIHRLVALNYIPNPENKEQVNHKDENKENNCINNLEWMTNYENCHYGTKNLRISLALKKRYL